MTSAKENLEQPPALGRFPWISLRPRYPSDRLFAGRIAEIGPHSFDLLVTGETQSFPLPPSRTLRDWLQAQTADAEIFVTAGSYGLAEVSPRFFHQQAVSADGAFARVSVAQEIAEAASKTEPVKLPLLRLATVAPQPTSSDLVGRVTKVEEKTWDVQLSDGKTVRYGALGEERAMAWLRTACEAGMEIGLRSQGGKLKEIWPIARVHRLLQGHRLGLLDVRLPAGEGQAGSLLARPAEGAACPDPAPAASAPTEKRLPALVFGVLSLSDRVEIVRVVGAGADFVELKRESDGAIFTHPAHLTQDMFLWLGGVHRESLRLVANLAAEQLMALRAYDPHRLQLHENGFLLVLDREGLRPLSPEVKEGLLQSGERPQAGDLTSESLRDWRSGPGQIAEDALIGVVECLADDVLVLNEAILGRIELALDGNRRNARMLTAGGKTRHQADWAKDAGLSDSLICDRLSRGWPFSLAVSSSRFRPGQVISTQVAGERARRRDMLKDKLIASEEAQDGWEPTDPAEGI